jgi:hypothetical protein
VQFRLKSLTLALEAVVILIVIQALMAIVSMPNASIQAEQGQALFFDPNHLAFSNHENGYALQIL